MTCLSTETDFRLRLVTWQILWILTQKKQYIPMISHHFKEIFVGVILSVLRWTPEMKHGKLNEGIMIKTGLGSSDVDLRATRSLALENQMIEEKWNVNKWGFSMVSTNTGLNKMVAILQVTFIHAFSRMKAKMIENKIALKFDPLNLTTRQHGFRKYIQLASQCETSHYLNQVWQIFLVHSEFIQCESRNIYRFNVDDRNTF